MTNNPKFYVATLAAAVERAARVAPTKGIAYDKAAGIVLDVDPESKTASLRSTNLEVYYHEEVKDVISYGDDPVSWRFPSHLLNGVLSGLPVGKEVTFKHTGEREVKLYCGKKQAKLRLMAADLFPAWVPIDRSGLRVAPGFAKRVNQVAWAVDPQTAPFAGIHVTGSHLVATDRYRAAVVPCEVALEAPVTVPLSVLAPVLKSLPGEVSLYAADKQLVLTVGDEIEVRSTIFDQPYPDLLGALAKEFAVKSTVDKDELYNAVQSMQVLVKSERYPRMSFDVEEGGMSVFLSVPETGDMSDVLELKDVDPTDAEFSIAMAPDYLLKALDAAESKYVTWSMGPSKTGMTMVHDDAEEYSAYLQPMGEPTESTESTEPKGDDE